MTDRARSTTMGAMEAVRTDNGSGTPAGKASTDDFDQLVPLIVDEWPQVDGEALRQTRGDLDLMVALIATETEHSKALIRKQLDELRELRGKAQQERDEVKWLRGVVERMQARSHDLGDYVKESMLDDARGQVNKNPLVALLMAVGLGFIFGFILRGLGRGRG